MKDFLRALIASIIFLGASTSMTAVSSTQIMISLRPTVTVPGYGNDYDEEGETGERRPGKKLECTIDSQNGVRFLSGETPDFILYEIYDCDNVCVGAYGDEPEFIDALFSLTGEYRISLDTAEVSYIGYIIL